MNKFKFQFQPESPWAFYGNAGMLTVFICGTVASWKLDTPLDTALACLMTAMSVLWFFLALGRFFETITIVAVDDD